MNFRGIEFGNLFNELGSIYGEKFEIDESKVPNFEERK